MIAISPRTRYNESANSFSIAISEADRRFIIPGRPPVGPPGFAEPGVCVRRRIIDCDRLRNFDFENSLIAWN